MYNGVGLATPRGSGTSGHVQRNSAALPRKGKANHGEHHIASLSREPNEDILDHTRKREIEIKCIELSDILEEQGYAQKEIDIKVDLLRKRLLESYDRSQETVEESDHPNNNDSHSFAEAQLKRNDKLKDAFGLIKK